MGHKYENAPKPKEGETNPIAMQVVVDPNPNAKERTFQEPAPIPETHPGGYYHDRFGNPVDANGIAIVPDSEVDDSDEVTVGLNEAIALGGASNPLVQKLQAQANAKARKQAKKAPEQPEDQKK